MAIGPEQITSEAQEAAGQAEDELRYPAVPEALRQQFRETGAIVLPVPGMTPLTIVGKEISLTSYGDRRMDIPTVQILGVVSGFPNSTANILLGEYGVYGDAELLVPGEEQPRRFEFDAEEIAGGIYVTWAHTKNATVPGPPSANLVPALSMSSSSPQCSAPTPPPSSTSSQAKTQANAKGATGSPASTPPNPCHDKPDCSGGHAVSWVTFHAEKRFVDAESNWRDRILSAAAKYTPMWQGLCITLRSWPVGLTQNVLETDVCSTSGVLGHYSNWIANTWSQSQMAFNDDAFQLWTSLNLEDNDGGWPPEAYCFGTSLRDRVDVSRTGFAIEAVSVVEGLDYCCADNYDPDEADERGIVSGHELSHTFGEENHPYKCRKDDWYQTAYDCNMMRNCKDPDRRSFFFVVGSKQEIMSRYHYGLEAQSGIEGQADCP